MEGSRNFAWQATEDSDKLEKQMGDDGVGVSAGPQPPSADKRGVPKALSNPSSTGSAGPAFEVQVQAAFVVALATGGFVPAVQPWPVVEVRLQTGSLGYKTDDFLVTVKHAVSGEEVRLLGQIKLGVRVTEGDATFGEVMTAAWADFNNTDLFAPASTLWPSSPRI